ncbi:MAG: hypothetical protein R2734_04060 [Nocardioides sp.]
MADLASAGWLTAQAEQLAERADLRLGGVGRAGPAPPATPTAPWPCSTPLVEAHPLREPLAPSPCWLSTTPAGRRKALTEYVRARQLLVAEARRRARRRAARCPR